MRFLPSCLVLGGLLVSTAACEHTEEGRARQEKVDEAAHKAGADVYKAAQKTKEATAEAAEDLKRVGHEAKQGWEDAKHPDPHTDSSAPNR